MGRSLQQTRSHNARTYEKTKPQPITMKLKTQVHANEGCQDLTVTREFNLPLQFLFKAYTDAELLAQWMGTTVIKLDCQPHGGYRFETRDKNGNVFFSANGTIHKFVPNKPI